MPELLSEGTHIVKVSRVGLHRSKSGNASIKVGFVDRNGDYISTFLSCTPKAWEYTDDKLKILGWDAVANGYRFEDLEAEDCPMIDNKVEIVVQNEEWEGKVSPKVRFINTIGGAPNQEKMTPQEAKSFASDIRAAIGIDASDLKKSKKSAAQEPQSGGDDDDDGIPF